MPDNSNGPAEVQPEAAAENQTSLQGSSGNYACCGGSREDGLGPLPVDLGGYQHVSEGFAKRGDIIVIRGFVVAWAKEGDSFTNEPFAVYRKMPCAQQGDCDQTGWKARQEELMAAVPATKAKTYDNGKPPLAYLPWAGIDEVAMVQAYGHQKYKDFNNYRKGMEVGRNLSCAIRHIRAYMEGEDLDQESHRNHLAHAACRLLFVLQNIHDKTQIDDRFKKGNQ